nr:MFS transporter [Bacteroidota bacterium]
MRETKFQSGKVTIISFAHLLHDVYSSFLAPILPLIIEKLSISYSLAGLLTVIQRLPFLLNPFFGLLADRMHMRYLIIFTPLVTAVCASLMGLAPNYTLLAILLFVMGVSAALFHVPSPVMIRKVSGNYIGRGMSFYMFGGEVARSIGPLFILSAVSLWGLERTYLLIPIAVVFTVFLYFKLKDISISEDFKTSPKEKKIKATIRQYTPFFLTLSGFLLFRTIMKSAITAFLPTFLTEQGETVWFGGIALAVIELAGAAGTLFAGTISDKIGRKTTLIVATVVSPVLFWLFIHSESTLQLIYLIFLGLFLFASGPVLLAMVQDLKSDRPAFLNGVYMTVNFFLSAVAVLLVGAFSDIRGMFFTFEASAILALFSVPFAFLIFKKGKSPGGIPGK